jgi:4-hydroxybenzoate polyprenyltransferase
VAAASDSPRTRRGAKLALFAADIKISHTIFAMPWAILATVLAWHRTGGPLLGKLVLIVVCMITARTVAMASNRLLDAELDKRNPRTARRAIPSGQLSARFVTITLLICAAMFIATAALFFTLYNNIWPLILSVPVLALISSYPLLKRFTRLCHYYLGAALALAPICAYIAIAARIDHAPIIMAIAVLCWTAGFDIIYACQDYTSDLETGVVSVPARVGIAKALWISRLTHAVSFAALVALGLLTPELSLLYYISLAAVALLLIIEHALVSPANLTKVSLAFFTVNGIISLLVGTLGVVDVLL